MEEKLFELMSKMYNEIQDMKTEIIQINQKLDNKADKTDIVRLENTLGEKIEALFDAREVQLDKDIEVSTTMKRVENKVDKLELKVLRSSFKGI